jgi:6-phosphogluconolactonase (cycloisomerase 2 family)
MGWFLLAMACGRDSNVMPTEGTAPVLGIGAGGGAGAVFVASNATAGNAVLLFRRDGQGELTPAGSFATGGTGTGAGLGNQGGLALAEAGRLLYVVNAGSDQISGFQITPGGLELLGTVASGGDLPVSLTVWGDLLYVLHNGAAPNVTGFRIGTGGQLSPIPGSTRPLSGPAPDAAQVGFSPDGDRLVVTEKATNQLVTFPVLPDGTLGSSSVITASQGQTPFGFAFDKRGTLIVSEAFGGVVDASAMSSYRPNQPGWDPISASIGTTETAACWVAVTPNGRFAYTTNTGSASISGYAVGADGSLSLLDADGVTGSTGAGPIDVDVSRNGRFLYTLNSAGHSISGFRVEADGALTPVATVTNLPVGANGLVAL